MVKRVVHYLGYVGSELRGAAAFQGLDFIACGRRVKAPATSRDIAQVTCDRCLRVHYKRLADLYRPSRFRPGIGAAVAMVAASRVEWELHHRHLGGDVESVLARAADRQHLAKHLDDMIRYTGHGAERWRIRPVGETGYLDEVQP